MRGHILGYMGGDKHFLDISRRAVFITELLFQRIYCSSCYKLWSIIVSWKQVHLPVDAPDAHSLVRLWC